VIVLYHFTVQRYAASIRRDGLLSIAAKREAGMYPNGWQPAPPQFPKEDDLVWLTRRPDGNAGIQGTVEPKIRVTVEVDNAIRWTQAADRYGVSDEWRKILRDVGLRLSGPENSDRDWYVVEDRIPPERILAVEVFEAVAQPR
jgi:hypothetical protein